MTFRNASKLLFIVQPIWKAKMKRTSLSKEELLYNYYFGKKKNLLKTLKTEVVCRSAHDCTEKAVFNLSYEKRKRKRKKKRSSLAPSSPSINSVLKEIENLVPPTLQDRAPRQSIRPIRQNGLVAGGHVVEPLPLRDIVVAARLESGRLLVVRVRADELSLEIGGCSAREGDGVVAGHVHADGSPGEGVARRRGPVGPVRGRGGKPQRGLFAGLALAVVVDQVQCLHAVACPEPARDLALVVGWVETQVHVFGAGIGAHPHR